MRKITSKAQSFIKSLHEYIICSPQSRKDVARKTETQIQTEIRPVILGYLERYFNEQGYKDFVAKANKSFYWEGEEGAYGRDKKTTFAARNYPDFIILKPYLIAIEYKKASSGSVIKQAIGQSIIHTLCGEFDFVYLLFHDENKDKRIRNSIKDKTESYILNKMKKDFNVFIEIV